MVSLALMVEKIVTKTVQVYTIFLPDFKRNDFVIKSSMVCGVHSKTRPICRIIATLVRTFGVRSAGQSSIIKVM